MILCASGLRLAAAAGTPEQVVRLASDAGFDGVAISADCPRAEVALLAARALSAGLTVPMMAAPLAEGVLAPDRRLPYLAALDDDDERRAAVELFAAMLELAVPLGVRRLTVHLGEVPLRTAPAQIAYRFARRELLDEDEPGARAWAAAVGERRARSGLVLDACRHALDRVLPLAERRDVSLALEVAGGPWSAPTPREALHLLDEYATGPLGLVWDQGRVQVLDTLGIAPAKERRATLAARATVWRANEAVGIEAGYLPGLGDPAPPEGDEAPAAPARTVIVAGPAHSTADEVAAARLRVAAMSTA